MTILNKHTFGKKQGGTALTYAELDPAYNSTTNTLHADGDGYLLGITSALNAHPSYANIGKSSGKWYFEINGLARAIGLCGTERPLNAIAFTLNPRAGCQYIDDWLWKGASGENAVGNEALDYSTRPYIFDADNKILHIPGITWETDGLLYASANGCSGTAPFYVFYGNGGGFSQANINFGQHPFTYADTYAVGGVNRGLFGDTE